MSTIVSRRGQPCRRPLKTKAPPRVRRMQITSLCLLMVAGVINTWIAARWRWPITALRRHVA